MLFILLGVSFMVCNLVGEGLDNRVEGKRLVLVVVFLLLSILVEMNDKMVRDRSVELKINVKLEIVGIVVFCNWILFCFIIFFMNIEIFG